jgi:5'-3' exonuclease
MGISGLNQFLKQYGKKVELSNYRNKIFAIDTSIYMYKFKYKATTKQFLKRFEYQVNQFDRYNIKPIYIFDGEAPIEKKLLHAKRKKAQSNTENAIIVTKEDKLALKNFFIDNQIEYLTAPTEGEKYCSYLASNEKGNPIVSKYADVCMTNDLDSLLFGSPIVLTSSKDGLLEYNLEEILGELNITLHELIYIGIVSGCDYHLQGIPKYGIKTALNRLKKERNISNWKEIDFDINHIFTLFTDFTKEIEMTLALNETPSRLSLDSLNSLLSVENETNKDNLSVENETNKDNLSVENETNKDNLSVENESNKEEVSSIDLLLAN